MIAAALARADMTWADIESCLDFGCGYGRVLRWLRLQLEPERLVAADIDPTAVRFCADEFHVRAMFLAEDVGAIDGKHSAIWVGSVFAHLPEGACAELGVALGESLLPGGVLVFSAQGGASLERLGQFGAVIARQRPEIEAELTARGISHRPYPHYRDATYGLTWHARRYFEQLLGSTAGLTPVLEREAGWCDHHDVYAFQRAPSLPQ